MAQSTRRLVLSLVVYACFLAPAFGQTSTPSTGPGESLGHSVTETGGLIFDGVEFDSWRDYAESEMFRERGLRCGSRGMSRANLLGGSTSDCDLDLTDPTDDYDPVDGPVYRIPVVVHVIQNEAGDGDLTEEQVESQIEILNEDFRALAGTPGEDGVDTGIEFYLATEDPDGEETDGITYTTDDDWFDDIGDYFSELAWDPDRYLNIYTNSASGFLGYVNYYPQEGNVGDSDDGVVCLYSAFGRDSDFDPFDQGRTATHEVGHYLGLWHVFDNGCGDDDDCYETGDRICDTNGQSFPNYGCPSSPTSCGSDDPYTNYMDYTDDTCMDQFTDEQARRMRCTLEHWRPDLYEIVVSNDDRADAFVLDGDSGTLDADSTDATVEDDEPEGLGGASVWWTWTLSVSGTATIDTNGSDFDTTLTIYDGELEIVAEDDDGGDGLQSEVVFDVDGDVELLVRVAGYDDATGSITLSWELETGPPFVRGDVTEDGQQNLSDVFTVLGYLYLGAAIGCEKAADFDDDDTVDLTDVIDHLGYQFLGGLAPAEPFPACGGDPTTDEFSCEDFAVCP